jgi:hypothetical protein
VAASIDRANFQFDGWIGTWCCCRVCDMTSGMLKYCSRGSSSSILCGRQWYETSSRLLCVDLPDVESNSRVGRGDPSEGVLSVLGFVHLVAVEGDSCLDV